jgi:1,2-diacylglycerol 3-alpha-glucosyltransferase
MKIVHLCLSCFYIDGFAYQENQLVAQNVSDGNEVLVITSTETYGSNGQLEYISPKDYMGADGARVIRLPYQKWLPHVLMRKLRMHNYVYKLLHEFNPDVILFHGCCGWELLTVRKYVINHPDVKFYIDSHEDQNNSAKNFWSKEILHKIYYKKILNKVLKYTDSILYISIESKLFLQEIYNIKNEKLEFFPLGGNVFSVDKYNELRVTYRSRHCISDENILFVQTGKMDVVKKLVEALRAFTATANPHWRFIIAGVVQSDIKLVVEELIANDSRIQYLGWLSSHDLASLLCAADVYVQPGTQSATMQMSLCCRCVVVIDDVPSHQPFMRDNGWLINETQSLDTIFAEIALNEARLPSMSNNSATIASDLLDYKKLAARLYR